MLNFTSTSLPQFVEDCIAFIICTSAFCTPTSIVHCVGKSLSSDLWLCNTYFEQKPEMDWVRSATYAIPWSGNQSQYFAQGMYSGFNCGERIKLVASIILRSPRVCDYHYSVVVNVNRMIADSALQHFITCLCFHSLLLLSKSLWTSIIVRGKGVCHFTPYRPNKTLKRFLCVFWIVISFAS